MIARLTMGHCLEIERLLHSGNNFQLVRDDDYQSKLAAYIVGRLDRTDVTTFGMFAGDRLVAFVETSEWNSDARCWSLGLSASDRALALPRARDSRWPQAVIDLVNHAVATRAAEGRDIVWTLRPDDDAWVPLVAAADCVLRDYAATVEHITKPWERLEGKWRELAIVVPTAQRIVKMTPPERRHLAA